MLDQVQGSLETLYGVSQAPTLYDALLKRIELTRSRIKVVPKPASRFSERDVTLITYGDSLWRDGEKPLQTLAYFVDRYLAGLISTVHILPFFPYSSDDGFSVIDYKAVNPQLGDWEDIRRLTQSVNLMADLVLNHASAKNEWFQRFLADDPAYSGLFMTASPDDDLRAVVRPRTSPLLTPFQKANGETVHVWTTFSADQVDLDFRDPKTLLRMVDVLLFYVEQGARVIRLDAVAFLWKEIGTSSLHLPQTHAAVQILQAVLTAAAPDALLITETNVPHAENITYWGDGYNEAQMVYNFTLPPLLVYTMMAEDSTLLTGWVNTLQPPSPETTFFNFTASHDGIGVRPLENILNPETIQALLRHVEARGGRISYKNNPDGSQSPYELNITYVDAISNPAYSPELQVRQFMVSQAIMLALAGVPAIYIHSLLGSHNDLDGLEKLGYNRAINRAKLSVEMIEAELIKPDSFRAQVFNAFQQLIQTRIQQPAFHPNARQTALDVQNKTVFALLRETEDHAQRLLALYNITAQPQKIALAGYDFSNSTNLLTGKRLEGDEISLEAFEVAWLVKS